MEEVRPLLRFGSILIRAIVFTPQNQTRPSLDSRGHTCRTRCVTSYTASHRYKHKSLSTLLRGRRAACLECPCGSLHEPSRLGSSNEQSRYHRRFILCFVSSFQECITRYGGNGPWDKCALLTRSVLNKLQAGGAIDATLNHYAGRSSFRTIC